VIWLPHLCDAEGAKEHLQWFGYPKFWADNAWRVAETNSSRQEEGLEVLRVPRRQGRAYNFPPEDGIDDGRLPHVGVALKNYSDELFRLALSRTCVPLQVKKWGGRYALSSSWDGTLLQGFE